ncbi:MAG: manganese transporter permease [Alphaproteobacteria bacterium]
MTDAASVKAPLASRLWTYQAERFPLFKHGLLIVAFGASAVCLSNLLRGSDPPKPYAILVAVLVLFGFFLQLRIADEHKDNEDDTKYRPERPVPRGLVTLGELRWVALVLAIAQIALTASLDVRLLGLLVLVWAWMALMTKEFFVPAALKARPILYMVSHMMVMPLIDLYATACDWLPVGLAPAGHFGMALGGFLGLSLANGIVLEIARKSWAPEQEREGVETYSKLWKPERAGITVAVFMFIGLVLSAYTHVQSGAGVAFIIALLLATAYAMYTAIDYAGTPTLKTSKALETGSGVFVLANYLLLGVLPMAGHLWLS